MKWLKLFLKDEEGVTAVEYGLMLALLAVVIIIGAQVLGTNTNAKFEEMATEIESAGS